MDRVNSILNNPKYRNYVEELDKLEKNRKFCRHNMDHYMSVARIAYIMVLENGLQYSKEVIYAIALLHDIGRVLEYNEGIPHDKGSIIIAKELLNEVSFTQEEKEMIYSAIEDHRGESRDKLSEIIYKSDKKSRECYRCDAKDECYWKVKNLEIEY